MRRGDIYRTSQKVAERGNKAGFYVIVSRTLVAENEDIETVICAPVYSLILGLPSEVAVGPEEGLPHKSAVRCDYTTLMFKAKLTQPVGMLSTEKLDDLNRALKFALGIPD